MPKIKAVLFDFDGVLRDSVAALWVANRHALSEHGITMPSDEDLLYHMHHIKHAHAHFASHVPRDKFLASFHDKFQELQTGVSLYEGTSELLQHLSDAGYILGMVTSARYPQELLGKHGLVDAFAVIIGGNDTERHKPYPDPVVKALESLEIKPRQAVMIGDMAADIQAAKAAGLYATMGITHGVGTHKMLEEAGADYVVDSFAGIEKTLMELQHGS